MNHLQHSPVSLFKNLKSGRKGRLIFFYVLFLLILGTGAVSFLGLREALFPSAYREMVKQEAEANDFDPLFIAALIYTESRFGPNKIAAKGEVGLMQIRPSTLKELERKKIIKIGQYTRNDLKDPMINVFVGTAYLKKLELRVLSTSFRKSKIEEWYDGDLRPVLLHSYNAGPTFILQNLLDSSNSINDYQKALLAQRPTTVKYGVDVLSTYNKLQWIDWIVPY